MEDIWLAVHKGEGMLSVWAIRFNIIGDQLSLDSLKVIIVRFEH